MEMLLRTPVSVDPMLTPCPSVVALAGVASKTDDGRARVHSRLLAGTARAANLMGSLSSDNPVCCVQPLSARGVVSQQAAVYTRGTSYSPLLRPCDVFCTQSLGRYRSSNAHPHIFLVYRVLYCTQKYITKSSTKSWSFL